MTETTEITQTVGQVYLAEMRRRLSECHERITHCLDQLNDAQVWWRPHESMNSIANLVLHLSGNLRQWIVSAVGGAADVRNRPQEFSAQGPISKNELLEQLNTVVTEADAALGRFDETQLLASRRIQGFDGTVLSAIFGCLTHLSGHTQEIIYITRLQLADAYRFAWVPTTPEQGATNAAGETVAVRDATFEEMPGHPLKALKAVREELPTTEKDAIPPRESRLKDYLLDLEQEFQDEQDEGKV